MLTNKPNPIAQILAVVVTVGVVVAVCMVIVSYIIAFLWNAVMPVLGLPVLTKVQSLAFFLLFKALSLEYKRKPQVIHNYNVNSRKDELSERDPINRFPA